MGNSGTLLVSGEARRPAMPGAAQLRWLRLPYWVGVLPGVPRSLRLSISRAYFCSRASISGDSSNFAVVLHFGCLLLQYGISVMVSRH